MSNLIQALRCSNFFLKYFCFSICLTMHVPIWRNNYWSPPSPARKCLCFVWNIFMAPRLLTLHPNVLSKWKGNFYSSRHSLSIVKPEWFLFLTHPVYIIPFHLCTHLKSVYEKSHPPRLPLQFYHVICQAISLPPLNLFIHFRIINKVIVLCCFIATSNPK